MKTAPNGSRDLGSVADEPSGTMPYLEARTRVDDEGQEDAAGQPDLLHDKKLALKFVEDAVYSVSGLQTRISIFEK